MIILLIFCCLLSKIYCSSYNHLHFEIALIAFALKNELALKMNVYLERIKMINLLK